MITPEIQFALGLSYYNLGNISSAKASFGNVVKISPEIGKAYFYLARCSNRLGNTTEAIASYRKVIALNPNDFLAFLELGQLLLNLQENTEGIQLMEKAVRLNRELPNRITNWGGIFQTRKIAPPVNWSSDLLNPDQDGAYRGWRDYI
jgi:tetratricopeptide (TPR) repeat protein